MGWRHAARYLLRINALRLLGSSRPCRPGRAFGTGMRIVSWHIRSTGSPLASLLGIDIYILDDRHHLREYRHAAMALFRDSGWSLRNVRRRVLDPERVKEYQLAEMTWNTTIEPNLLDVVAVRPESMAIWELYDYLGFLHANGLDAGRHELAFWRQILMPVTTMIMVILSIPFVFGSLRSASMGRAGHDRRIIGHRLLSA